MTGGVLWSVPRAADSLVFVVGDPMTIRKAVWSAMTLASLAAGCSGDDVEHYRGGAWQAPASVKEVPAPLGGAHCDIDVEGVGVISMEEDYLPHVIQCENGGANLEALKAQAIAARSVAYYAIETSGGICDSQGCQVYSCGADPDPIHYQAVNETSGQYLMYNNTLTYGFYVAGDSGVASPACVGVDGNAATEHWITYNSGRTGTDVEQSELGFVHAPGDNGYGQNRGCMGQWAARCLENDNGVGVTGILQFFYGDDIGVVQAPGDCVMQLPGESSGAPDPTTGAAQESTGADTNTDSDATTMPPATTTMDPSTASDSQSDSDATITVGGSSEDDGTAAVEDDGPNALPDTYGESTGDGGCGCTSDAGSPASAALMGLVVLGATRRRRARR